MRRPPAAPRDSRAALTAARPRRGGPAGLRIAVLSRRPRLYTIRRLRAAANARGHSLRVLDPLQCYLSLGRHLPGVSYQGRALRRIDVVLPRIGPALSSYALAVVKQLELMGLPVVNSCSAISRARDKLLSLQLLTQNGVAVPRTVVARNPSHVGQSLAEVGGPPVVLKLFQGTHGVGVMLAETELAAQSMLDTLWSLGQNILIQEFVAESRGRDLRALVIGGEVVAAMRREAKLGEFRSNIHRGGKGTRVELGAVYRRAAIEATRVMGLDVAGVDMLESVVGPKVIEINASPGFEGLEAATGVDIAGLLIERVEAHAARRAEPSRG
ncbi:MAG: RimK family alpha-L-glutamate ligase [Gemmatimonadota bacterium]